MVVVLLDMPRRNSNTFVIIYFIGYQFNFSDLPDNHAEAICAHPRCALVAGVNRGRDKLVDFGQRFDVSALYHDYRQMLREVAPDICIITTHPQHHAEMVTACAAEPTTRAIICEKPMARTSEEAEQMIQAARESSAILMPAMCLRFWPEWKFIKEVRGQTSPII